MKQQRWEELEKRKEEETKSEKIIEARANRQKVAKHRVFFPMFCGCGGSRSRLAKAADAEPAGEMRDQELHAARARSRF